MSGRTRRSTLAGSRRRTGRTPVVAIGRHLLRNLQCVTEPLVLDYRPLVNRFCRGKSFGTC
jgi:hypothetical protein